MHHDAASAGLPLPPAGRHVHRESQYLWVPYAPGPAPAKGIIGPSPILEMLSACRKRGGIDLASGIPSHRANPQAVAGAIAALKAGANVYSDTRGLPALRAVIADRLRRENHIPVDAEHELLITSGLTGGFTASLLALFNPGDEILVLEPFFGWHVRLIRIAGLVPRFVRLEAPTYTITATALREAIGPRTRGLVICTPVNPSGKVFTQAELQTIARVADERDLLLLTDEQYERFCFDGARHISPAAVAGLRRRTITLGGFSKSMSITGWRLGYAAGPAALIEPVHSHHQALYICPATPLQHGLLAALETPDAGRSAAALELLAGKRDRLCKALTAAGFQVQRPQGGFFVLADASEIAALPREHTAMALLEQTGVAAVPSHAFSTAEADRSLLRFCFAKDDTHLQEASRRLLTLLPKVVHVSSDRIQVRLLESAADHDAAARLAYKIYVEELGLLRDLADHERRMLVADDADHSQTIGAFRGDCLVGAVSLHFYPDAPFSDFYQRVFDLPHLETICPRERFALVTRLLVVPEHRGRALTRPLVTALLKHLLARRARLVLADCQPHFISLYGSAGMRPFGEVFNYADNGVGIPLIASLADREGIRARSPQLAALLPAEIEDTDEAARFHRLIGDSSPILSPREHPAAYKTALERLLQGSTEGPQSDVHSPFFGFADDELAMVLRQSAILRGSRGIKVISQDQNTRTVFVVLDGCLEVHHDHGQRTINPGEICGEISYLIDRRRTADVYIASDHASLLSLNERTMRALCEGTPALAARFLGNLARIMAARLAS